MIDSPVAAGRYRSCPTTWRRHRDEVIFRNYQGKRQVYKQPRAVPTAPAELNGCRGRCRADRQEENRGTAARQAPSRSGRVRAHPKQERRLPDRGGVLVLSMIRRRALNPSHSQDIVDSLNFRLDFSALRSVRST